MAWLLDPKDPNSGAQILSEQSIEAQRKVAAAMMKRATEPRKMTHWSQALAQGVDGLFAGLEARRVNEAETASNNALADRLASAFGGSGTPAAAPGSAAAEGSPAPSTGSLPSMVAANEAYPPSLISSESGGNWGAQNDAVGAGGAVGHFGRLQFGQARLAEAANAGVIPQGTTPQAFMASPEMQKAAERWHFADIDQNMRSNGLDKAIGSTIGGVPVTLDGMRAVAHLGGNRGLQRFIETGGQYNPQDRNGTSLLDYLRRHGTSRTQTAAADLPAPGAVPAEASTGQSGFVIPGGGAPVQSIEGDDPATLRDDAAYYAKSNPEAARQLLARAEASEARANVQPPTIAAPSQSPPADMPPQGNAPLVFPSQGTSQPWMGTALPQSVPAPAPAAVAQAAPPMPPPRPADLAMPQADLPAPGAVPAIGQLPTAAPIIADPTKDNAGVLSGLVASEEQRKGLPSGAGITSPFSGIVQALAARGTPAPTAAVSPAVAQVAGVLPPQPAATVTASPAVQAVAAAQRAAMSPQAKLGLDLVRIGRRAEGMAILNQAMKPVDFGFQVVGDQMYRTNPRTGAVDPVGVEKPVSPVAVSAGQNLVNPRTGKVVYSGGAGFRPLTDPVERQRFGIPADDTKPYQVGPDGKLSSAGGGTTVNVDTKGAGKFAEKANEIQAKRYGEMVDGGDSARMMQGDIDTLEGIANGIATGRGAEAKLAMAQFAKAWGFDDIASGLTGGKLAEMEAFSSVIDRLTPQMRQGMPGAASDRDVAIFKNALPSMLKTPDGNKIVIGTLRSMNAYKMQAGDIAGQAIRGEISQAEADKQIKALGSPFSAFKEFRAAQDKQGSSGAPAQPQPNGVPNTGQTKSGLKWSVQ